MKALALSALRLVLAGIFLYAAVTKLVDMRAFAEELANFHVLPASVVPIAAAGVPGVEILIGLLLALGMAARAAAAVSAGLLVVFIAGLSQALVRDIDLRCGCFGGADVATWGTVARDVVMLVPALLVLAGGPGRFTLRCR
jgi:putative oxidoreductase